MDENAIVAEIVAEGRAVLAGHRPWVQGAALADLVAIWLAGHIVSDEPLETATIREQLLTQFVGMVRTLIPINEAQQAGVMKGKR